MNEVVVQVIVSGDKVYGLTASGHLAEFNQELNAFVIKSKKEVYDRNSEIVKSHIMIDPQINNRDIGRVKDKNPVGNKKYQKILTIWVVLGVSVALFKIIQKLSGF